MKTIGLTMRVDHYKDIGESRDAIDQRWYPFLKACNLTPVLLPNFPGYLDNLDLSSISGFVLTGGNSLMQYGGDADMRDNVERQIIDWAIQHNKPLLGVCRGMQVIQEYFGVNLTKISAHVKCRHIITYQQQKIDVNSFHQYAALETVDDLTVLARSDDNVIEAIKHTSLPICGIMWHPEREATFSDFDINLFTAHFNV